MGTSGVACVSPSPPVALHDCAHMCVVGRGHPSSQFDLVRFVVAVVDVSMLLPRCSFVHGMPAHSVQRSGLALLAPLNWRRPHRLPLERTSSDVHGKTRGFGGQLSIQVRATSLQRLHAQQHPLHGGRRWPHARLSESAAAAVSNGRQAAASAISPAFKQKLAIASRSAIPGRCPSSVMNSSQAKQS